MKRAKITIVSYYVECPYCKEELEQPMVGSLIWDRYSYEPNEIVECEKCGRGFTMPSFAYEESQ